MAKPTKARLFFALDLPEAVRGEIAAWRQPLAGVGRPVAEESLHVTLAFLGWRDLEAVEGLASLAAGAIAGLAAPALTPVGLRAVPPRRPRLFALDLDDAGDRCARVHDSLASAGIFTPEKRPFWPHVTLARVKKGGRAKSPELGGPPGEFVADRVVLLRSHLSREGARYEALWVSTLER